MILCDSKKGCSEPNAPSLWSGREPCSYNDTYTNISHLLHQFKRWHRHHRISLPEHQSFIHGMEWSNDRDLVCLQWQTKRLPGKCVTQLARASCQEPSLMLFSGKTEYKSQIAEIIYIVKPVYRYSIPLTVDWNHKRSPSVSFLRLRFFSHLTKQYSNGIKKIFKNTSHNSVGKATY